MNKQTQHMIHVAFDTYAHISKKEFHRILGRLIEVEKIEPQIIEYKIDNIA